MDNCDLKKKSTPQVKSVQIFWEKLILIGQIAFTSGVLSIALMNLKQHLMILAHEMFNSVNELAGWS